jgi:hypothetical protein
MAKIEQRASQVNFGVWNQTVTTALMMMPTENEREREREREAAIQTTVTFPQKKISTRAAVSLGYQGRVSSNVS